MKRIEKLYAVRYEDIDSPLEFREDQLLHLGELKNDISLKEGSMVYYIDIDGHLSLSQSNPSSNVEVNIIGKISEPMNIFLKETPVLFVAYLEKEATTIPYHNNCIILGSTHILANVEVGSDENGHLLKVKSLSPYLFTCSERNLSKTE